MKLLALDIASTTGFCVLDFSEKKDITIITKGSVQSSKSQYKLPYPQDVAYLAYQIASNCWDLIIKFNPDIIVVEDTNIGGKASRVSQKTLEFAHAYFLEKAAARDVKYISTSQWRDSLLSIKLSDKDKINNKKILELKNKANKSELDPKLRRKAFNKLKKEAGVSRKKNKKDATVEYINKIYALDLATKDHDIADAIALGTAYLRQF